ncbi:MAG: type II toxin-antitoxin system PemK/MazF family toxin [Acidimicrobiales bacterium]|nr:type II toxin-antitoxin system PemK/MazF family toxin [Acidimicrobiales bacterium]MBO0893093.1 type II toxin-antitoxin system PemK/MazF family toxin [Acidimicrobiales bacterium]
MARRPVGDPAPRRGDIWLAELDKRRPVVVLTRDPMGRVLHSVLVGPVTSTVRGLSTEVVLGPDDGVRTKSVVNVDNLQLLHRSRLVRRVGRAAGDTMSRICAAVGTAIDCPTQAAQPFRTR